MDSSVVWAYYVINYGPGSLRTCRVPCPSPPTSVPLAQTYRGLMRYPSTFRSSAHVLLRFIFICAEILTTKKSGLQDCQRNSCRTIHLRSPGGMNSDRYIIPLLYGSEFVIAVKIPRCLARNLRSPSPPCVPFTGSITFVCCFISVEHRSFQQSLWHPLYSTPIFIQDTR